MTKIIRWAIRNGHAVAVLALTVLLLSGVALTRIPVDILPLFATPAVQILTLYPGMPAEVMEQDITTRLERWTGQANGIAWQEARSLTGVSVVRDYFREGVNPDAALAQVSALAMSDLYYLPPGTVPPMVMPYDPTASIPLCLVTVSSEKHGEKELYDIAYYQLRNRLQSIPGVVSPAIFGGKLRRILAYVDPEKLASRELSPMDVVKTIQDFNVFLPVGVARIGATEYQVDANAMVHDIRELDEVPIRTGPGGPVLIGEVAKVEDSSELQTNIVRIDGKRQVYAPIYRQPGANTIQVVEGIRQQLGLIRERLPEGVELNIVMDQTIFIRKAVESLEFEALFGAFLASLLVLVFLQSARSMMFILVTMPLSVASSLIGLYFLGASINTMTLGGLALAVGMLLDNGIVFLENSLRLIEEGRPPLEAAREGAEEVARPVLVATLTIIVVFFPVIFLSGLGKFLFVPLAQAVSLAMAASYVLSITIIPSLVARFLNPSLESKHADPGKTGPPRSRSPIERIYEPFLDFSLSHPFLVILATLLLFIAFLTLYPLLGQDLFPTVDSGQFTLQVRAPSGTRLEVTEELIGKIEERIQEIIPREERVLVISNIGVFNDWPAAYTPNAGPSDAFIAIQLAEDRKSSSQEWAAKLRSELEPGFPGVEFSLFTGGLMSAALNFGIPSPIDIQIEGKDLKGAHQIMVRMIPEIRKIEGTRDVRIQQRLDFPLLRVTIDRVKTSQLGLDQNAVVTNLTTALNSSVSFAKAFWIDHKNGNHYFIGAQYPEALIRDLDSIRDIPITAPGLTQTVTLRDVATFSFESTVSEVTHRNITRVLDLFVNVEGRDVGSVAREIQRVIQKYTPDLPQGLRMRMAGEVQSMQESFAGLGFGLVLAIILVYLVMVVHFRSFLDPLIVLVVVPLGLSGVFAILFLTNTSLNIQSLLGTIAMVGLATSYNILLVDFANQRWNSGTPRQEAIRVACLVRLRPILMTSLAAILGLVPMAIHAGEANAPLARAIIGGLLVAKVMTLVLVPALYQLLKPVQPVEDLYADA